MRKIEIDGVKIEVQTGLAVPSRIPGGFGRPKGPIRQLCEQLRDGESAFVPVPAKRVESANLHSIGKAIGAKFAYRSEVGGVRIYRLASEAAPKKRQLWAA